MTGIEKKVIDTDDYCLIGLSNLRDRGFANENWTLQDVCQTRSGLWQAMSIGHFVVGTKTSGGPTGTTTGMKFSKHGYPSRDSPNLHWVFRNKSKGKVLTETTLLVQKATRGRRDFVHQATK